MNDDDMEFVREYALRQSEQAFETLVSRYVNLVYSAVFHAKTLSDFSPWRTLISRR